MEGELSALQQRLAHVFSDPALLRQALTHRSASAAHNERLEFLGDAVLNLAVAALLYERLGALPEGDLSKVRASLVREETLHGLAAGLKLAPALTLGEGLIREGDRRLGSILADALEALIGAVYLDAGYPAAEAVVRKLYEHVDIHPQMAVAAKDAKTELQEWLQARRLRLPLYQVVGTTGAAHRQTFDIECEVPQLGLRERGIGASRRAGEQAAAWAMLASLKARETA